MPDIRHLLNDDFLFQEDGVLAHHSCYTVSLPVLPCVIEPEN